MNSITKAILVKILSTIMENIIIPEAQKYVAQTTNDYDDQILKFLQEMYSRLMQYILKF